jgi:hypothetical protein
MGLDAGEKRCGNTKQRSQMNIQKKITYSFLVILTTLGFRQGAKAQFAENILNYQTPPSLYVKVQMSNFPNKSINLL